MRFKRIISTVTALILAASCLAGCTGCSAKDESSQGKGAATTTTTTSVVTTTTVTVAPEDDDQNTTTVVTEDTSSATTTTVEDEQEPDESKATTTTGKADGDESKTTTATTTKPATTTSKKTTTTAKKTTTTATTTKKTTTTKKQDSSIPSGEVGVIRNLTTQQIVSDMGVGINLGNTFESCGSWINSSSVTNFETAWGSCVITENIIKGYKEAGFGVVRVPVAWSNMMGTNYQINEDYLARVKEVVGWIIENDMYVILNVHWDGGWINNYEASGMSFSVTYDECKKKYTTIWETLCEEFKDEGDYLMFESLNEEGCWDDLWNRWGGTSGKSDAYGLLNDINQMFVDIVRDSGGNNAKRHLLIAGYATDVDLTCDSMFKVPDDPMDRCAVSVHYYTPSTFCILEKDESWGKASSTWGTASEVKTLKRYFDKLKTTFVDKGVPVIIGEYGCPQNNKELASIRKFITTVSSEAIERSICPVLWDTFDNKNPTKCFYNRSTCEMNDEVIAENFLELSTN